jgi:hypothetical protein
MDDERKARLAEGLRAYRESGVVAERLDPLQKAAANPSSLRRAINGKCYDCVGRDADAGWRKRVAECDLTKCPLWNVRQFKGVVIEGEEEAEE